MSEQLYWHFVPVDENDIPRLTHGDGREVKVGETLVVEDEPERCKHGLHASKRLMDACLYCPDSRVALCLVALGGTIRHGSDKSVATERTVVAMLDAGATEQILRAAARQRALSVAHLWDMPDIVRRYLEMGDESLCDAAAAAANAHAAAYARDAYAAYAAADRDVYANAYAAYAYAAHAAYAAYAAYAAADRGAYANAARAAYAAYAAAEDANARADYNRQSEMLERMVLSAVGRVER